MTRWHFAAAILFVLGAGAPETASALLRAVELREGAYVNRDADTRSITRMAFEYGPSDEPRCTDNPDGTTTCKSTAGRDFHIRLWGACSPQDCDWGTTEAEFRTSNGAHYVAHYDQGFAQRRVEIYPQGNSKLRLVVHSSYDDERADRTSTSIMVMENVSWEPGTNRPGSDYRNFALEDDRPGLCARACESEYRCEAFTYVKPGIQGPNGRCWLKDSAPQPVSDDCCVAGVK